ncbi:MAG: YafY family transcriptional regulator [Desulfobacterales bacterium]|nr:YafY family transcriptional regulator [Desulfobacterales bacterium]
MRIDRLIGIVMILVRKRKVTARELADRFEVSIRTIQRDLDALNMAGIPLYAEVGVHGGYRIQENFRLEKGFLNKDEAGVLHAFLKELEGVTPHAEVGSLYDKFACLDSQDMENRKLVVQLLPAHDSREFRRHLSLLCEARDRRRKLALTYYDVRFEKTARVVAPHCLVLVNAVWYLYGYCDLRSDFRMFKVSRIAECTLLDESFPWRELPEDLPWESDDRDEGTREEIVLEIHRDFQHMLPDFIEPARCRIVEDNIIVTLRNEINEWLYAQLLSLAPHVKVVQPESLRAGFVERLEIALLLNDGDPGEP